MRPDRLDAESCSWEHLSEGTTPALSIEMRQTLADVLRAVRADTGLQLVHRLFVERGLNVREAASAAGRSRSGMGRLAERYAAEVRRVLIASGWVVPGRTGRADTHGTLAALGDLLRESRLVEPATTLGTSGVKTPPVERAAA